MPDRYTDRRADRARRGASPDYAAIAEVNTRAFGRDDEARLVKALRCSEAYLPGLSLVAELSSRIVGHILFTRVFIRAGSSAVPAVALAPMSVLPEMQRRGIGSQLLERGLAECVRLGHKIVVVLGHKEFYPRFGFTPGDEKDIGAPFEAPREAFMVKELVPGGLTGVTGIVEYPREFAVVAPRTISE